MPVTCPTSPPRLGGEGAWEARVDLSSPWGPSPHSLGTRPGCPSEGTPPLATDTQHRYTHTHAHHALEAVAKQTLRNTTRLRHTRGIQGVAPHLYINGQVVVMMVVTVRLVRSTIIIIIIAYKQIELNKKAPLPAHMRTTAARRRSTATAKPMRHAHSRSHTHHYTARRSLFVRGWGAGPPLNKTQMCL